MDSRSLPNGALFNALVAAGVEGISAYQPRSQLLEALAGHVQALKDAAADKAVADWVTSKARPAIQGYLSTLDGKGAQTQLARNEYDHLPQPPHIRCFRPRKPHNGAQRPHARKEFSGEVTQFADCDS